MHHFLAISQMGQMMELDREDVRQIRQVLRMRDGAQIIVIWNQEHYRCQLQLIGRNDLNVLILEKLNVNNELPVQVTLVMALIRSAKWDWILQKATECGVTRIVPFQFKRSVVQLDDNKKLDNKMERWNRICKEATEQSRRNLAPRIDAVTNNLRALENLRSDINLVAYESAKPILLQDQLAPTAKSITIVIGPEGGFEPEEIIAMEELGFTVVTLGHAILRAETAALFSTAIIKSTYETHAEHKRGNK